MVNGVPFQFITDEFVKLFPFIIIVKEDDPALILLGIVELIDGTGLLPFALIVKTLLLDTPPPGKGFTTDTFTLPVEFTRLAFIIAVS